MIPIEENHKNLKIVERKIHWAATDFRHDCEKIAARFNAGTIDQEMAMLQLELAYYHSTNLAQIVRKVLMPLAKEHGVRHRDLQRMTDAIVLQRPVIKQKYLIYKRKFIGLIQ